MNAESGLTSRNTATNNTVYVNDLIDVKSQGINRLRNNSPIIIAEGN